MLRGGEWVDFCKRYSVWGCAERVNGGGCPHGGCPHGDQGCPAVKTRLRMAAWLLVIPGVLVLAAVMTKLIAVRPESTGAGAIVSEALGPLPGMLINWSYWVSIWSANAVLSQTAVRYLAKDSDGVPATGGTNWQKYLPARHQKRVFYPALWTETELAEWGKSWVISAIKPYQEKR